MKNKHVILLILLLPIASAFSQEKLQLSLSEAQNYAIEHNKTLQNARLDVTLSERKIKETIAQGLPQLDASLDWMTYFGYEMEFPGFGGGGSYDFTPQQLQDATMATLSAFPGNSLIGLQPVTNQDLYNYSAGSYYSGMLQGMMPPTTIKMTDASTAKLQVGQLLFSGQYWTGIKVARLGKKIAEQGLENSILDIKESVTSTYMMALVTAQTIETFKKNIENLKQIKGHTENMFTTGMAEQTDVDQISIQVTMLENTQRSMERGLQMIYSMLKFQLGLETNDELTLADSIETVIAKTNPTNSVQTFDITNNIVFKLMETQESLTEKMVDMQKMAFAPTITGFYAYNQKLLTTGFDMTPNHVAGVTMSLPLFSGGKRNHQLAQAKIQLNKVQINKSMVEEQLAIQQKQLQLDLKTAIENYNSQKDNVEVARRVYANIQNKFKQGVASSLDLTQSNNNYLQAESGYIQSILSLLQAKVALDKLHNQL
jgi:outer membrane protein TolC